MKEKLIVLEKANELGEYIFLISDSAPKKYRFTFVSRMQNLMPDIIENLYKVNYVNLSYMNDRQYRAGRLEYQEKARNWPQVKLVSAHCKGILFLPSVEGRIHIGRVLKRTSFLKSEIFCLITKGKIISADCDVIKIMEKYGPMSR